MFMNNAQCSNCNCINIAQTNPNTTSSICKCQQQNVQIIEQDKINQPHEMQNAQQINQCQESQNDQTNNPGEQAIFQNIVNNIKKHNMPYNESESMAIYDILHKLLDNNIIRGEKTQTIACVVEYMILQLSSNPELNNLSLDQIRELNNVNLDTVKKLWNSMIDNQSFLDQVNKWEGQRPISELKHLQ